MLIERIGAFVRGESDESFDELALEVFRAQHRRDARLREECQRLGVTPQGVSDWRQVPPMAAAAGTPPPAGDAAETAAHDALHRAVIDRSLPGSGLDGLDRPTSLSLIPTGDEAEPGIAFLAEHLLSTLAAPDSVVAVTRRRVEVARARSFLGARQRDRRPTLVLATAAALDELLEGLTRRGLRFRLPAGSRVAVTGRRGSGDPGLPARLGEGLGVPADGLVRVYGVEGLITRFWAGHGRRGEPRPFRPPPWTRVRILGADCRSEVPAGAVGAISVFDLASLGGAAHRLTGDAGIAGGPGFRLA